MVFKHLKYFTFLILLLFQQILLSQSDCHPTPQDFQFVYDQAGLLNSSDQNNLNNDLRDFTKQTSNAVVVLTTNDLCGYDKAEYTYSFGDKAGVGRADLDNGVVIMVKPKTQSERGEAFIAVGTGLQGAIPDILAGRIIQNEMIPAFKQGDYALGIKQAVLTVKGLASGEISESEYGGGSGNGNSSPVTVIFMAFFIIMIMIFIIKRQNNNGGSGGGTYRNTGGGWMTVGGGSGWSSGGSSGGFGGFGGGGFDGGGAGGSW